MVTLLCFCCDHRNPAGARFCNACGTPLHLKPCRHCEAINVRAAAHCHQCGETFGLEFASLDEVERAQDAPKAAPLSAPVEAASEARSARPRWRSVATTRIVAVFLGLAAIALLSAYYAYRHPGGGFVAASVGERSQPAGSSMAPDVHLEATPTQASVPGTPAPTAAAERSGAAVGEMGSVASADVDGETSPNSTTTQTPAARPRPGAKRNVQGSATKSKAEPAGPPASQVRGGAVATSPPASGPQVELRPQADPGPIALQQRVVAPPARAAATAPTSVQRPREPAKRPAPATGGGDRPCAEGVALESNCDVRFMPKGN